MTMADRDEQRAEMEVAVKALHDVRAKLDALIVNSLTSFSAHGELSRVREPNQPAIDKAYRARCAVVDALAAVSAAYAANGVRPA